MVSNNGKSINLPSDESRQLGGASQHLKRPCGPSLRRDKQLEEEIKSDLQVYHPLSWELKGLFLQVTPAFQKFVASKLDNLLELEDVEFVESTTASNAPAENKSCLGVRLTKDARWKYSMLLKQNRDSPLRERGQPCCRTRILRCCCRCLALHGGRCVV